MSKIGAAVIDALESGEGEFFAEAEKTLNETAMALDGSPDEPAEPKKQNVKKSANNKQVQPAVKQIAQKSPTQKRAEELKELAGYVKEFAEKNHQVITTDGKNYIKASVWQFIADMLDLRFRFTDWSDEPGQTGPIPRNRPLKDKEGNYRNNPAEFTYAAICGCRVTDRKGHLISEGVSYATNDEEFLKGKDPVHTFHLAQTRAMVRAMRNRFGAVVVMAGYDPTPFEEVINDNFKERVATAVGKYMEKLKKQQQQQKGTK